MGGTIKASIIKATTIPQYTLVFSRSKYTANGETNNNNEAKLIAKDFMSVPVRVM